MNASPPTNEDDSQKIQPVADTTSAAPGSSADRANIARGATALPSPSHETITNEKQASYEPLPSEPDLDQLAQDDIARISRSRKLTKSLWLVLLLSLMPLILTTAGLAFLELLAQKGFSGMELLALTLLPLVWLFPVALPIAVVVAVALIIRDKHMLRRVFLVIVIIVSGIVFVPNLRQTLNDHQKNSKLSSTEAVALIKSCQIRDVSKIQDGKVYLEYVGEGYDLENGSAGSGYRSLPKPHYAESSKYPEYIKALKEAAVSCPMHISYQNDVEGEVNDPTWPGDKWISRNEALALLKRCALDEVEIVDLEFTGPETKPTTGKKTDYALRVTGYDNIKGTLHVYVNGQRFMDLEETDNELYQSLWDAENGKCNPEIPVNS